MSKPIEAVLIGAGDRGGAVFGSYALEHTDEIRFVAVAEPLESRRQRFAAAHGIPPKNQFRSWEDLCSVGKIADAALVTTLDHLHFAPTTAAMEIGYDVLLEKPMATTAADCVDLVQTAERTGRLLQICHELRYTNFFATLHDIVTSGRLGDIITVEYRENLVYWAQAHAFVRGHWGNSQVECPKVLAKGCHDLDILHWSLGTCKHVSSFGSLMHFRPENAPAGAPERCTDGCPAAQECPWHAPSMYLEIKPLIIHARHSARWWERLGSNLILSNPRFMASLRSMIPALDRALDYRGWPISVISEDTSPQARLHALETGPWGRCVYHCDNDVVDHQLISMEMESGASVSYVMNGHSHEESRAIRFDGSRATLRAKFTDGLGDDSIEIHDHLTGRFEKAAIQRSRQAHGGGDQGVMAAFVRAVHGSTSSLTTGRDSLESHLVALAAEQSRLHGCVIDMNEFRRIAQTSWSSRGNG